MKTILYTQRVEVIAGYNERRDCTDQNVPRFLSYCGYVPVPIPNIPEIIASYTSHIKPDGIVLTGGNDLSKYGGNAPERDETERLLIEYALNSEIPLLGFCRGMQIIGDYFGAILTNVEGHVAIRHKITGDFTQEVNSYHNYAFLELPPQLLEEAKSDDGVIEAFKHCSKPIYGIMWHPERESPFQQFDQELVTGIFLK